MRMGAYLSWKKHQIDINWEHTSGDFNRTFSVPRLHTHRLVACHVVSLFNLPSPLFLLFSLIKMYDEFRGNICFKGSLAILHLIAALGNEQGAHSTTVIISALSDGLYWMRIWRGAAFDYVESTGVAQGCSFKYGVRKVLYISNTSTVLHHTGDTLVWARRTVPSVGDLPDTGGWERSVGIAMAMTLGVAPYCIMISLPRSYCTFYMEDLLRKRTATKAPVTTSR